MKDIETGETIGMDTLISIGFEKDNRVYMEISTFSKEIGRYNKTSLTSSEMNKLSLKDVFDKYILLNYDNRDQLDNVLDGPNPIFLLKEGEVFKKTIEYFATKERISIN